MKEITIIKKDTKTGEVIEKIVFVSGDKVTYEIGNENNKGYERGKYNL